MFERVLLHIHHEADGHCEVVWTRVDDVETVIFDFNLAFIGEQEPGLCAIATMLVVAVEVLIVI